MNFSAAKEQAAGLEKEDAGSTEDQLGFSISKGTLLGTPNREPQEYSRNIIPGRDIPIIYLLYSWGSRFGVPSGVPLI